MPENSAFDPNKVDPRPELIFSGMSREEADKSIGLTRGEEGIIFSRVVDTGLEVTETGGVVDNNVTESE